MKDSRQALDLLKEIKLQLSLKKAFLKHLRELDMPISMLGEKVKMKKRAIQDYNNYIKALIRDYRKSRSLVLV